MAIYRSSNETSNENDEVSNRTRLLMPSLRLAKIDQLRLVGCLIFLVTSTINIMNEYQGIYLILTVFARVVVSLVHMKFNVDNKEIHLGIYHPESNLSRAGIRAVSLWKGDYSTSIFEFKWRKSRFIWSPAKSSKELLDAFHLVTGDQGRPRLHDCHVNCANMLWIAEIRILIDDIDARRRIFVR